MKRVMLVYQAGIANVFEVDCFNLAPFGRNAKRVMQHAFSPCENYARGRGDAGDIVRTVGCNQAGDITDSQWTDNFDDLPFSAEFNPVKCN